MPIPASYTESTLADYMLAVLGKTGDEMGYDNTSFPEEVNDTLLAYGVTNIATVTGTENIRKLRALAKVQAWTRVVNDTTGDYQFTADGASHSRQQINAQARTQLAIAQAEAASYDSRYRVGVDTIRYKDDPYSYLPDELRTL